MASAVARAYNLGVGAEPPAGSMVSDQHLTQFFFKQFARVIIK